MPHSCYSHHEHVTSGLSEDTGCPQDMLNGITEKHHRNLADIQPLEFMCTVCDKFTKCNNTSKMTNLSKRDRKVEGQRGGGKGDGWREGGEREIWKYMKRDRGGREKR